MRWLLLFLVLLPLSATASDLTPEEQALKMAIAQCVENDKRWKTDDSWNERPSSACQRIGFNDCLLHEQGSSVERSTHCAAAEAKLWSLVVEDLFAEVVKRAICRDAQREAHGWTTDSQASLKAAHETWLARGGDDCMYIAKVAAKGSDSLDATYCL